jgi:hypothetical protein
MRHEIIWHLIVGSSILATIGGSWMAAVTIEAAWYLYRALFWRDGHFRGRRAVLDPGPTLYSPAKSASAVEMK